MCENIKPEISRICSYEGGDVVQIFGEGFTEQNRIFWWRKQNVAWQCPNFRRRMPRSLNRIKCLNGFYTSAMRKRCLAVQRCSGWKRMACIRVPSLPIVRGCGIFQPMICIRAEIFLYTERISARANESKRLYCAAAKAEESSG